MKATNKSLEVNSDLGRIKSGQVCPMPAKGAMGSAIVTIIL
jgi:hypothetical protein